MPILFETDDATADSLDYQQAIDKVHFIPALGPGCVGKGGFRKVVSERWFRRLSLGRTLVVRMSLIRQNYFRLLILGESAQLKLPNE